MVSPEALSPLFSPLCLDIGWSFVAATYGNGKGMITGLPILVLKVGALVSCDQSSLVLGMVLGSESGLVVSFSDGIRSLFSLNIFSF